METSAIAKGVQKHNRIWWETGDSNSGHAAYKAAALTC